jgi:hypothetical protein
VIASLSIVMAFQLFVATARVSDHLVKETAARDLGRSLLASLDSGSGQSGMLFWTSAKAEVSPGLALHHVTVRWPGGPDMVFDRYEALSKAAP